MCVASKMKFFVATVIGWGSLTVVSKMSILISTGAQDLPLVEIEISKLNKHRISGRVLLNKFLVAA